MRMAVTSLQRPSRHFCIQHFNQPLPRKTENNMNTFELHFSTFRQLIKSTGRAVARTWKNHCQLMATNRSYRRGVLAALTALAVATSGPFSWLIVLAVSVYAAYYEGTFPETGPVQLAPTA